MIQMIEGTVWSRQQRHSGFLHAMARSLPYAEVELHEAHQPLIVGAAFGLGEEKTAFCCPCCGVRKCNFLLWKENATTLIWE